MLLFIPAVIAVASSYNERNEIQYDEDLDYRRILSNVPQLAISDYSNALQGGFGSPWVTIHTALLFPLCWVSTLALFAFSSRIPPSLLVAVLAAQCMLFLLAGGLLGLITLPWSIVDTRPHDGEWLGEHRPVFHVLGLWGLFCGFAARMFRTGARAA
ncbi:MAG: hypothetical protein AAF430_17110 [Myxococcota bacterium]